MTMINDGDIVNFGSLSRLVLGKWRLVSAIIIFFTAAAILLAFMLPVVYRAELLVAPNEQNRFGPLSGIASQYGELASIAGLNIGSGNESRTELGLETLKSRRFISQFIRSRDLLVPLMATKAWNRRSGELVLDADEYDVVNETWVRSVRFPRSIVPSDQEAYKVFMEDVLSIAQDKKTGFITIQVRHASPTVARDWATWLLEDLNEQIMKEDVRQAEQAISYLTDQLEATSASGIRSVFFNLIEDKMKVIVLSRVSNEYLFRTIDPAIAPERRHSPNRVLIALVGMLTGMLVSMVAVLFVGGVIFRSR